MKDLKRTLLVGATLVLSGLIIHFIKNGYGQYEWYLFGGIR